MSPRWGCLLVSPSLLFTALDICEKLSKKSEIRRHRRLIVSYATSVQTLVFIVKPIIIWTLTGTRETPKQKHLASGGARSR